MQLFNVHYVLYIDFIVIKISGGEKRDQQL